MQQQQQNGMDQSAQRQEGSFLGQKHGCIRASKPCGERGYKKVGKLIHAFDQAQQQGGDVLTYMQCPTLGTAPLSAHPSRANVASAQVPLGESTVQQSSSSESHRRMSVDNESLSSEDLEIIRMLEELQLSEVTVGEVQETFATDIAMSGVEPGVDHSASDTAIHLHGGGQERTIIATDGTTMQQRDVSVETGANENIGSQVVDPPSVRNDAEGVEIDVDVEVDLASEDFMQDDDFLGGLPSLVTSSNSGQAALVDTEVLELRSQLQQQQQLVAEQQRLFAEQQAMVQQRDQQLSQVQAEVRMLLDRSLESESRMQQQVGIYQSQLSRAQQEIESMRVLSHALQSSSMCDSEHTSEVPVPSMNDDVHVVHPAQQPLAEAAGASSSAATGNRPSLVPSSIKLERPTVFHGKHSETQNFIFEMRTYIDSVNLGSDGAACRFVQSFLKGPAKTWWQTYSEENKMSGQSIFDTLDLDTLMHDLEEQFSDSDREMRIREKLLNLRMRGTLQDYITLFRQYQIALGSERLTDSTALHVFQLGLAPNIRDKVMVQRPKTIGEAVLMASSCNSVAPFLRDIERGQNFRGGYRNYRKQYNNQRSGQSQYSNSRQSGPIPMVMGNMQQKGGSRGRNGGSRGNGRNGDRGKKDVVCWHCNRTGHTKADCWQLHGKPGVRIDNNAMQATYPAAPQQNLGNMQSVPPAVQNLAHVHGMQTAFVLPDGTVMNGQQYNKQAQPGQSSLKNQPKN